MALTRQHKGESGPLRPGDVVFDYRPTARYPLHAGIYVGERRDQAQGGEKYEVRSLPGRRRSDVLGSSSWGEPNNWQLCLAGRRTDRDVARIKRVAFLSEAMETERGQLLAQCCWDQKMQIDRQRTVAGGVPLFVQGTCAHFVEYLYENTDGMDLVLQQVLFDPNDPDRLYPATLIRAFWKDQYPLSGSWDDRLARYEDCLYP